jgi:alpha-galactosidase/6-phospho-beta-glucosidase family protein
MRCSGTVFCAPLAMNLNSPNVGQIPQLPDGAVVETRGVLDASGCRPLVSPLSPALAATVAPHVWRQELTVEAALEGDADKVLAVLATDPLSGPAESVSTMLDQMLAATRPLLPQFE